MAAADFAQDVLDRDVTVFEHQRGRGRAVDAKLLLFVTADESRPAFDQKRGELLAVNLGEYREQIGEASVGDPHFLTVEDVVTPVGGEHGFGLGGERVRARLRLGQGICADPLAACEEGEVLAFLLFGAEEDDRQRANINVRAMRSGERSLQGELLADHCRADFVQAEAAVFLGDVDREQA